MLMERMWMLAVGMLGWGNIDSTKHQVFVRVVMCWIHRYGEHIYVGIIGMDGLKTRFLVWINMNGTWVGSIQ